MLIFSVADENKLARFQVRQFVDPLNRNSSIIEGLSGKDLIESAAKRVVLKHAQSDRVFFILKNVRWPFDEFYEVIEKRRFSLILDRRIGLCPDWNCVGHANEKRHSYDRERRPTVPPRTASQSVRMIRSHFTLRPK